MNHEPLSDAKIGTVFNAVVVNTFGRWTRKKEETGAPVGPLGLVYWAGKVYSYQPLKGEYCAWRLKSDRDWLEMAVINGLEGLEYKQYTSQGQSAPPIVSYNPVEPSRERVSTLVKKILGKFYLDTEIEAPFLLKDQSYPEVDKAGDPADVCCLDGVVNMRTLERGVRGPERFDPVVVPVEWDEGAECPLFEECLDVWGEGEAEWKELALRMMAYSLMTRHKWGVFFVRYGESRSGKSTLDKVETMLLGGLSSKGGGKYVTDLQVLAGNHGTEGLEDARAISITEASELTRREALQIATQIKNFAGGESIRINPKNVKTKDVAISPVLTITGNDIPALPDSTHSLWNKAVILPFMRRMRAEEQDPELDERLRAELPGIFRLVMEAGQRMWASAHHERWPKPRNAKRCLQIAMAASNPVAKFVAIACREVEGALTDKESLYEYYREIRREKNIKAMSKDQFFQGLRQLGYDTGRGAQGKKVAGLRIAPVGVDDE
mgnify:CR=1 FL=1